MTLMVSGKRTTLRITAYPGGGLGGKMLEKFIFAVALAAIGCSCGAAELRNLNCDLSVKSFFTPLIQGNVIERVAYRVHADSTNFFRPAPSQRITAYGLPVVEVFGYTDEPLLFQKGQSQRTDIFGVVVRESVANVQAQLKSFRAEKATAFRIDSQFTAIACRGAST